MEGTPLEIPEILGNILQYVDSKTLVAAAQVNSLWANEATNWIWRGQYRRMNVSLSAPLRILTDCSQDRRDWYTGKIRFLELGNDYDDYPLQVSLVLKHKIFHFTKIKSAIVDIGSDGMKEEDMAQFLSPNLVSLELFGGYYTRWFFEQIKAQSPSLQFCLIDNRLVEEGESPGSLDAADFLNFLRSMESIKHLELHIGWEPLLDENVMRHLILRPNLEKLSLGYNVRPDWRTIPKLQDENPSDAIFSKLRCLEVTAEEEGLRTLLPTLQHLQGVSITQLDGSLHTGSHLLTSLASCSLLEEITFDGEQMITISSPEFLRLASGCPLIRRFEITGECQSDDTFTDELIESLASIWKHLVVFSVSFTARLSTKSLVSFAHHCPSLYELKLMTSLELRDLSDHPKEMIFPCLVNLELGQITTSRLESDQDVSMIRDQTVRLLDDRFPMLCYFDFVLAVDDDHSNSFNNQIGKHLKDTRKESLENRPRTLSHKLVKRLIEPVPGSKYNSWS